MVLEKGTSVNPKQAEFTRAVKIVYDSFPQLKMDGGKSAREVLKGDTHYSKRSLVITTMALGFKEMGLSQTEATQLLSQLSDQELILPTEQK